MLVWMMMMNVCGEQTERVALFFFLPPLPPKNGKRPFSSVRNANDSVKEKIRDVRFPRRHTRTILSPERPFPVLNSLCISRLFIQVAWVVASLYCVNTFLKVGSLLFTHILLEKLEDYQKCERYIVI